jgi:hypothetical protein
MIKTLLGIEARIMLSDEVTPEHALAMIKGMCDILSFTERGYYISAGASIMSNEDGTWEKVQDLPIKASQVDGFKEIEPKVQV